MRYRHGIQTRTIYKKGNRMKIIVQNEILSLRPVSKGADAKFRLNKYVKRIKSINYNYMEKDICCLLCYIVVI